MDLLYGKEIISLATYTYTYDFAGGTYNGSPTYSQTYNTANPSTSTLVTCIKPGYKFRWYTIVKSSTGAQLGQNAAAGQQIVVASNLTLRAVWDKIYYLNYKLNGGYFDSNYTYQQEKWYGKNVTLREAPKRTGYTFKGWRDKNYNGALWSAGQTWGADVNTTLTAEWSRNSSVTKATITYKLNGGTGSSSGSVNIGSSITLPTPTRSGYKFNGWKSNHDNDYDGVVDNFGKGATYTYSNTVTLTAQWVAESSYEVIYYRPKTVSGDGSAMAEGYDFKDPETKSGTTFTVTNGWYRYIFGHAQDMSGEYQWFDHFIPQPINYRANVNLMSMKKCSKGYLHKTSGALTTTKEYDVMASDYISVTAGTKYVYAYHCDLTKTTGNGVTHPWTRIWFYNSSKNIISGSMLEYGESDSYSSSTNLFTYEITAPSGAAYIRISSRFLVYGFGQLTTKANWNDTFTPSTYDFNHMYEPVSTYSNPDKVPVYLLGVFYANERTVTYNANGGSPTPSPSSFKTWYGRPFYFTETLLSKSNSRFLGWSSEKTAIDPTWTPGEQYTGQNHSYTVYAIFEVNPTTNDYAPVAMGNYAEAVGYGSVSVGHYTDAHEDYSVAVGAYTTARNNQVVVGAYNAERATTSDRFIVGAGTSSSSRKNAFRVAKNGRCYALTNFVTSGADYTELFEWEDGNPNNEDRSGLLVELHGNKIRLCSDSSNLLGIVSTTPVMIGDAASEEWKNKYVRDEFGQRIENSVMTEDVYDEEGTLIMKGHRETRFPTNDAFNYSLDYVPRLERREWDAIGLRGKLVVVEDGTCKVNSFLKAKEGGIGTLSEEETECRVMERIDENHVLVIYDNL